MHIYQIKTHATSVPRKLLRDASREMKSILRDYREHFTKKTSFLRCMRVCLRTRRITPVTISGYTRVRSTSRNIGSSTHAGMPNNSIAGPSRCCCNKPSCKTRHTFRIELHIKQTKGNGVKRHIMTNGMTNGIALNYISNKQKEVGVKRHIMTKGSKHLQKAQIDKQTDTRFVSQCSWDPTVSKHRIQGSLLKFTRLASYPWPSKVKIHLVHAQDWLHTPGPAKYKHT